MILAVVFALIVAGSIAFAVYDILATTKKDSEEKKRHTNSSPPGNPVNGRPAAFTRYEKEAEAPSFSPSFSPKAPKNPPGSGQGARGKTLTFVFLGLMFFFLTATSIIFWRACF